MDQMELTNAGVNCLGPGSQWTLTGESAPWRCFRLSWEEGLFLFPQVPHHLRSLHQLAACCSNSLVNLDCLVNYKHISKSFFLAFFLEWVTATLQLTERSSMVFSQGSGRNMPHRDLIIYQHNVGLMPMRHQYIFLWSLTYCLLLSMLFSWLADKITVAVSKFTSNWSQGEKCLMIGSSYRHRLILLWGAEGESLGLGCTHGPKTATTPCSGISPSIHLFEKQSDKFLAPWL